MLECAHSCTQWHRWRLWLLVHLYLSILKHPVIKCFIKFLLIHARLWVSYFFVLFGASSFLFWALSPSLGNFSIQVSTKLFLALFVRIKKLLCIFKFSLHLDKALPKRTNSWLWICCHLCLILPHSFYKIVRATDLNSLRCIYRLINSLVLILVFCVGRRDAKDVLWCQVSCFLIISILSQPLEKLSICRCDVFLDLNCVRVDDRQVTKLVLLWSLCRVYLKPARCCRLRLIRSWPYTKLLAGVLSILIINLGYCR